VVEPAKFRLITGEFAAAVMTSVTVVECVRVPLVPEIVNVLVPGTALEVVVIVRTEEPLGVTDDGLKLAEAPEGTPAAVRATLPANPPTELSVAV
jgi:hypothetical protein